MADKTITDKIMWAKALQNAKLIASSIMVFAALVAGTWTLVTSTFITRAEASEYIKKLDIDTSYNKAFRIESQLERLEQYRQRRALTPMETKKVKRLLKDIDRVDDHIYNLENSIPEK